MLRNRSGYARLNTEDVSLHACTPRSVMMPCRSIAAAPPASRRAARRRRGVHAFHQAPPLSLSRNKTLLVCVQDDWRSQERLRFEAPPEEVPWASVALAVFLAVFGAASLVLAWLHWTQQLFGKEQAVRMFN